MNNIEKQNLLEQLLEEQTLIKQENMPELPNKLNYLVHLPRKILRKALDKYLNKEDLRYLFGLLSECTGNGEINDVTKYQLVKLIKAKYGIDNCSTATLYKVHKKLENLNFICMNEKSLIIIDYKDTFKSGGLGSATLPSFIFNFNFKNASITAYRLMLIWMDNTQVINKKREDIWFKPYSKKIDVFKLLKKRCFEEIIPAINELKQFFDITELVNKDDLTPYYNVSLKKQYITDEYNLKGLKQAAHIKHTQAYKYITKYISLHGLEDVLINRSIKNDNKHDFEDLELKDAVNTIVNQLCTYTQNQIHRVLSILKNNLLKVRSIGAFIRQLIDIYIYKLSHDDLELKDLKKLINTLITNGLTLDGIKELLPDIYSKYVFLTNMCNPV